MLPHEFHPLAAWELEEAVDHYEAASRGKGLEVRSIVVQPTSRWEFTIHYRAKPGLIRLLAIAHQARQPFYWFGRR